MSPIASFAFTDATAYFAGYDFTTDVNSVTLNVEAEELDVTTFGGGGYRSRIGGLKTVSTELEGFWQSATTDAVDPQAFSNLGTADRVLTMSPTGDEDDIAYMHQAGKFGYQMFGAKGEATPFTLNAMGTNGVGLVRGELAKAKGNVSATGATGTGLNLGAVGASQFLYATFHVFGTPGTTITAVVESDDANTFASATTRITFGPITTAGGTWGTRVAGSITDTWYRLRVTAITGTFSIACAIGIQ